MKTRHKWMVIALIGAVVVAIVDIGLLAAAVAWMMDMVAENCP